MAEGNYLDVGRDVIVESLLDKTKGACILITGLPHDDCVELSKQVEKAYIASKRGLKLKCCVVSDESSNKQSSLIVTSTKVIELRNLTKEQAPPDILTVFKPQGAISDADDSFGPNNFLQLSSDAIWTKGLDSTMKKALKDLTQVEKRNLRTVMKSSPLIDLYSQVGIDFLLKFIQESDHNNFIKSNLTCIGLFNDSELNFEDDPDKFAERLKRNNDFLEKFPSKSTSTITKILRDSVSDTESVVYKELKKYFKDKNRHSLHEDIRNSPPGVDFAKILPLLGKPEKLVFSWSPKPQRISKLFDVGWRLRPKQPHKKIRISIATIINEVEENEVDIKTVDADDKTARIDIRSYLDNHESDVYRLYLTLLHENGSPETKLEADIREDGSADETNMTTHSLHSALFAFLKHCRKTKGQAIGDLKIEELNANGVDVRISSASLDQDETYQLNLDDALWKYEQIVVGEPDYIGPYVASKRWIRDPAAANKPKRLITLNHTEITQNLQSINEDLVSKYSEFVEARKKLFKVIKERPIQSISLLSKEKDRELLIDDYTTKYSELLSILYESLVSMSGSSIRSMKDILHYILSCDILYIKENSNLVSLIPPSNPTRLSWIKETELAILEIKESIDSGDISSKKSKTLPSINNLSLEGILGSIIPPVIWTPMEQDPDHVCLFRGTVNDMWAILSNPKGDSPLLAQEIMGYLTKSLDYDVGASDSRILRKRIRKYLDIYPHIDTIVINAINPGSGSSVLDAILNLPEEQHSRNFRINLLSFEMSNNIDTQIGASFDNLMKDPYQNERTSNLLEEHSNPLIPGLRYSKKWIKRGEFTEIPLAHISILFDSFSERVAVDTIDVGELIASTTSDGRLAQFDSKYSEGTQSVWTRAVHFSDSDSENNSLLNKYSECIVKCYKTASDTQVIGTRISLPKQEKDYLEKIYKRSDWVILVDRYIGIEMLDRSFEESKPRYLIDYAPEFQEELGYRIITSTESTKAITDQVSERLSDYSWYADSHLNKVIDALNSLSGILLMKYIQTRNLSSETTTLALAMLALKEWNNQAKDTKIVIVPIDAYQDLWFEDSPSKKAERADLLAICISRSGDVSFTMIESKCENSKSPIFPQRQRARRQLRTGKKYLERRFNLKSNRFLHEMTRSELFGIIRFHFEKQKRFGHVMSFDSIDEIDLFRKIRTNLLESSFEVDFDTITLYFIPKAKPRSYSLTDPDVVIADESMCTGIIQEDVKKSTELIDNLVGSRCTSKSKSPLEEKDESTYDESDGNKDLSTDSEMQHEETPKQSQKEHTKRKKPTDAFNDILLGYRRDKEITWSPYDGASPHLIIVGMTGVGKTQTMKAIIEELDLNGVHSLIFDFNDDYIDDEFVERADCVVLNAADGLDLNPLAIGENKMNTSYEVAGIIARVYDLGKQQERTLRNAIKEAYDTTEELPSFGRIGDILRDWAENSDSANKRNTADSLLGRIESLFDFGIFGGTDVNLLQRIFHKTHVIRLQTLKADPKDALKNAVVELVLNHLQQEMYARGHSDMAVYCMVDEAHRLTYKNSPIPKLVREARKYGVGIILSSQMVKDFDDEVLSNIGATIAFKVSSDEATKIAKSMTSLREDQLDIITKLLTLPRFEAIIRSQKYPDYTEVKILPFFQRQDN
ncbi:MAG: DUF87 domain-containing protein [Candidatus Thorarchaeota archaeon]|nr:DUF87 domain-containing protein [Candidatus Thorarchaeota archaeon]